jgi:hypothetical protein
MRSISVDLQSELLLLSDCKFNSRAEKPPALPTGRGLVAVGGKSRRVGIPPNPN